MPGIKNAQVYCQNKVFKTNIGKEVVENVGAESVSWVLGGIIRQK